MLNFNKDVINVGHEESKQPVQNGDNGCRLVLFALPFKTKERINESDGIYAPTQICDSIREIGIHTQHPNGVQERVEIEDKVVFLILDMMFFRYKISHDDRHGAVKDEVRSEAALTPEVL